MPDQVFTAMNYSSVITATILVHLASGVLSEEVFCHQCFNIDCLPGQSKAECEQIRQFVQLELRKEDYANNHVEYCPHPENAHEWTFLMASDTACPEEKEKGGACVLARLRIITERNGVNRVNYATLSGCATRKMRKALREANTNGLYKATIGKKYGEDFKGTIEIASTADDFLEDVSILCSDKHYCTDKMETRVAVWTEKSRSFSIIPFIVLLILFVVFTLCVGIGMCFNCDLCPHRVGKETEKIDLAESENEMTQVKVFNEDSTSTKPADPRASECFIDKNEVTKGDMPNGNENEVTVKSSEPPVPPTLPKDFHINVEYEKEKSVSEETLTPMSQ